MGKKAELLEQAQALKLSVTAKNTIAEIEAAIANASTSTELPEDAPVIDADAAMPEKEEPTPLAKAGKRSAKALKEAEEAAAKEARKESGETDEPEVKKGAAPKTRPLIERRSKAYREVAKKIENKEYGLTDALALAVETSTVKFDATVELHVRLNVDPRQADENIRGNLVLPNGSGKEVRVAVFGGSDEIKAAKAAGADVAGEADFLDQLKKEIIDFDVLISTPMMMGQLGKYARLLGPKGLMPNPKSGTVTKDIAGAVKQAKAGMVEYRVDPTGIIHLGIGKVSFGAEKLTQNAEAVMESIKAAKPINLKMNYIENISVSSSMGPGIKVVV